MVSITNDNCSNNYIFLAHLMSIIILTFSNKSELGLSAEEGGAGAFLLVEEPLGLGAGGACLFLGVSSDLSSSGSSTMGWLLFICAKLT